MNIPPVSIAQRFRLAMLLLVGVVVVGATGFHFLEGWEWFDGFYMTLITMTTVGYGEVHPLSHVGKIFNVFLILASVIAGGFLVATATQAMLEFELGRMLGRRRMEREIAKLNNHYIICGAGRVGRTVARELRTSGAPFVVLEKEQPRAEWAIQENMPVIIGSASNEETLQRARIQHAAGLIAAVTSDAENLYIVLTARGMRPDLKIIARASEEEAAPKLIRAGATQVVSPYHFVGRRIAHLLLRPHVIDLIETAFGSERLDVQIEEVHVPENSPIVGKTLATADIRRKTGVLVLAMRHHDGTLTFNPDLDAAIQAGDCLIAIGGAEHLDKLEALAGIR